MSIEEDDGIILFDVLVHGHEVTSHESFIAETPYDDRRMHLISLDECFCTVHVRMRPGWVVGCPFRGL